MKQKTNLLQVVLILMLFVIYACKSVKESQIQVSNPNQTSETISKCDQKVKYYSDRVKMVGDGQEIRVNTEIIINSSAKLISLTSEPPGQDKVNFDTVIESFDCSLNSDLTEGRATYKGYTKQIDGTSTRAIITIEAKEGSLIISNDDGEKQGDFIVIVSKWEIVKE